MKFLYFFIFLWVISALLDQDPATAATQINADPDPKPWFISHHALNNFNISVN
jgi:hypothetical protein